MRTPLFLLGLGATALAAPAHTSHCTYQCPSGNIPAGKLLNGILYDIGFLECLYLKGPSWGSCTYLASTGDLILGLNLNLWGFGLSNCPKQAVCPTVPPPPPPPVTSTSSTTTTYTSTTTSTSTTTTSTTSDSGSSDTSTSTTTSDSTTSTTSDSTTSTSDSSTSSTTTDSTISTTSSTTDVTTSTTSTSTTPSPTVSLYPGGSVLYGCAIDNATRIMTNPEFHTFTGTNTPLVCTTKCFRRGWTLAAVEHGDQCFCANSFVDPSLPKLAPLSDCKSPCDGDSSQTCGAGFRMQVYTDPTALSDAAALPSGWSQDVPCAADSAKRMYSDTLSLTLANNTPANCIARCSASGYKMAAVENSNECYCGTSYRTTPSVAAASQCTFACAGAPGLACGGAWGAQLYVSQ